MSAIQQTRFKPSHIRQCRLNWCVPACICSIMEMPGDFHNQSEVNDALLPARDAPTGHEIIAYFNKKGFKGQPALYKNIDDIDVYAESWRVIILTGNENAVLGGHAVAYWKCSGEFVYIMDPACDVKMCRIRKEEFEKNIRCCVLVKSECLQK